LLVIVCFMCFFRSLCFISFLSCLSFQYLLYFLHSFVSFSPKPHRIHLCEDAFPPKVSARYLWNSPYWNALLSCLSKTGFFNGECNGRSTYRGTHKQLDTFSSLWLPDVQTNLECEIVGSHSGIVEYSRSVGCDAVSTGKQVPIYIAFHMLSLDRLNIMRYKWGHFDPWRLDHYGFSKLREPLNQWRGVISHNNGCLIYSAVKT
jgi:hypothetical protein